MAPPRGPRAQESSFGRLRWRLRALGHGLLSHRHRKGLFISVINLHAKIFGRALQLRVTGPRMMLYRIVS